MNRKEEQSQRGTQRSKRETWLPDSAQESVEEYLSYSDEYRVDEADSLRAVDRLFRSASMLQAPPGFSEKLMAAIAAGKATARRSNAARYGRFRLFNLILAVSVIAALAFGSVATATRWIDRPTDPVYLIQQVVVWLSAIVRDLAVLSQTLAAHASGPLFVPGLLTTMLSVVFAWWWLVARVSAPRMQVVYRIPVRFH